METVTEQDSTGALTQSTNYSYDMLDDLVQINQGGQIRQWKYDASRQLLYENLPEQTATISDGVGGMWTTSKTYTSFGKIATRTDARGVVATYGYDVLNRLISVSYDTAHAGG